MHTDPRDEALREPAKQLGVSRTPLREVLRMLQEEGLVEIEPNQRTRVAGLDPQELDDVYASRILLETLALSMTLGTFTAADRKEARRLLTVMRRAAKSGDFGDWFAAHADYHRLITGGAGEAMKWQLQRWPTARSATSAFTRSQTRTAGRRPATWSTRRSCRRWSRGTTGRAHRDGSPPGAHRAAGAGRLRAGLRARRRGARGRAHRGRPARRAAPD